MCRTEIFFDTLLAVAHETEISADDILSNSRKSEIVDAKCILVRFLIKSGLNASEVSRSIHVTDRSVRRLNRIYYSRISQTGNLIARNSDAIRKQLGY